MAGTLNGFQTRRQISQYSVGDENLDIFLFPLSFADDRPLGECFADREIDQRDLHAFANYYDRSGSREVYTIEKNNNRAVPKQQENGLFDVSY